MVAVVGKSLRGREYVVALVTMAARPENAARR